MTKAEELAREFDETARSYDRDVADEQQSPMDRQQALVLAQAYRHAARRVRVVLVARARETDGGTP